MISICECITEDLCGISCVANCELKLSICVGAYDEQIQAIGEAQQAERQILQERMLT